jgi:hypothetical protein
MSERGDITDGRRRLTGRARPVSAATRCDAKIDTDKAVADALAAVGLDKLDETEMVLRVLKTAGIDVPRGPEPPKRPNR